jgi:hypothetical protein
MLDVACWTWHAVGGVGHLHRLARQRRRLCELVRRGRLRLRLLVRLDVLGDAAGLRRGLRLGLVTFRRIVVS